MGAQAGSIEYYYLGKMTCRNQSTYLTSHCRPGSARLGGEQIALCVPNGKMDIGDSSS